MMEWCTNGCSGSEARGITYIVNGLHGENARLVFAELALGCTDSMLINAVLNRRGNA